MSRVSIIMGIYNCASTLPEAIDSILNQTYQDWKLIMCDDGSRDDTYQVAESYQNRYSEKIVLIKNHKNMGLNYTLNHCLEYADTEYIARMDGDDISISERLEKEVAFLDSHPEYAIVSCPIIYFDESGEWGRGRGGNAPTIESIAVGTPHCHAPCMVRKEAYDSVSGYTVDPKLLRMEDYDLWVKMYAAGFRGYNLPDHLYMMRDDRNATTRRAYKYRINEARVRIKAIKVLHLPVRYYVFVLRPLAVGLLPTLVYEMLHKKKMSRLSTDV